LLPNKLKLLKVLGLALLAPLVLLLFMLPVQAIGGSDITLSSKGAAGPDIEISFDGARLAVVYYKQDTTPGAGAVYLKSATANSPAGAGWVSSTFLGLGSTPQVAFKRGVTNTVYVVWVNSTGTAIQSARCLLSLTAAPACVRGNDVRTIGVGNLAAPDIVVDGNNFLHVAWLNGNGIEMARSTVADSVTAWPAPVTPGLCTGNKAEEPVLGWTDLNDKVHLAFLCGSVSAPATSVEYRRAADNDQFFTDALISFTKGDASSDEIIFNPINPNLHAKLYDLALATGGSQQVSLVWGSSRGGQDFSLMSITSSDEGSNWPPDGSRFNVQYVPSGNPTSGSFPGTEDKSSTTSLVPVQEYGLRPSLVVSGTLGNAAVVWQQKRGTDCTFGDSSSSDIHFVNPQFAPGTLDTLEHITATLYSIDPDLAVGAGKNHFVFMKDDNADSCTGGTASAYAIYYRGPFTEQTYDQGEVGGGVFLPIIKR
jgi:hypothetical protein